MRKAWSLADAPDLSGRVAIVTGANTGLGYETALALAAKGARVILACRSRERAEHAMRRILSRHPAAAIEVRLIDTGRLDSVREFAESFLAEHERLDLLVNNAGIMITPHFVTEDGFEGQLGVNYLGHFLLTGLLLPAMRNTPGSRVVSLYSLAASWHRIQFEDPQFERKYLPHLAYSQSKLACLMFALELDRRLRQAGYETRAVAAHPGISKSDLSRNLPRWMRFGLTVVGPVIQQPAAAGAEASLYAALGGDLEGGEAIGPARYWQMQGPPRVVPVQRRALDESQRERLWSLSESLCGISYPG